MSFVYIYLNKWNKQTWKLLKQKLKFYNKEIHVLLIYINTTFLAAVFNCVSIIQYKLKQLTLFLNIQDLKH